MGVFENVRLRAGATLREWKEKRAEKKALKEHTQAANQLHGHSRFFLLNVPMTATVCAAFVEIYWAILFCIEATGRLDANIDFALAYNEPLRFIWDFAFSGHLPVLLGLVAATAPIVMISMVWLPVQFAMRGFGRWRRGSLIVVGLLANALVIVSGTVVMNHNRQEQIRDDLVIEQSADQGRAAIDARIQVAQTELARLTDPTMTTNEARAARAGVAGWATYVREASNDPTVPAADRQRIARAMGSAEAADALRARIEQLTVERATATPEAATAAVVVDEVGAELNGFAQAVEVWRPPFVALIATLIGVLGSWWTLAMLEGMNPKDVLRSGWAPEELRIEDKRDEAPVVPQPMRPAREVVTDADTGEELVKVKPREYWRKRKGQKQKLAIEPEVPPDERGVAQDGGGRIGQSVAGPINVGDGIPNGGQTLADNQSNKEADQAQSNGDANKSETENGDIVLVQPTPPEPEPEIDWSALTGGPMNEGGQPEKDEPQNSEENDASDHAVDNKLADVHSEDPQQTEAEADEPQPDEAVEQDNAERDDVEPRGLLPAA